MSEYNANDHLHNVTASIQQLTYQAQGVQDITGANVSDYEQISPDAAASVTLVNARQDVPFLALINTLPPVQDGEGTPALDNVRVLIPYTASVLHNGADIPDIEVDLPDGMYSGYVDFISRKIVIDVVRLRMPYTARWVYATSLSMYYIADTDSIPKYVTSIANERYVAGENINIIFAAQSDTPVGGFSVLTNDQVDQRVYFNPDPESGISSVEDVVQYLEENELYFYIRVKEPVILPLDTSIPYVMDNNYTVSVDSGTLTVKYQGIAPEQP